MPSVWFLDCTFLPDLFTRHWWLRSNLSFEPRCLSPHPHSIHKRLGDVRGTAQGFPGSVLRQSNWRLLLLSLVLRSPRFTLCRRQSIIRCATFRLHSGACVVLGGWFRSSTWRMCMQGRLLLASFSLLDDPVSQIPSQPYYLSPSVGLYLGHRKPVRPTGCPSIA